MTDIETEVSEFRRHLEDAAVFDLEQIHADVQALARQMGTAATHELAAGAVRDFYDARRSDRDYARAVILSALSMLATGVLIAEPTDSLPGPDGALARLQRLAYAVRAVGVGLSDLRLMYEGVA